MNISPAALRRLQVLYSQFERRTLDASPGREARLAWASAQTGRTIASFSTLSIDEGIKLIDNLQRSLRVKVPSKTPRRRMDRKSAEKAGTEGRRDQIHAESTLASAADLARIQDDLTRLGWDQARLEAFLRSSRSPLKGRAQVRTLAEANRLHWALKHIPAQHNQRKDAQPIAS